MMSPFAADTVERAIKNFISAVVGFAVSDWVSQVHYRHFDEKAAIWAAATTGASVLMSVASRRFGQPGTASLTREVTYR